MDDGTNVFFEKDDTQTSTDDKKSTAKKGKADDSEFYDDMPREIVEYLIKTHPLNEENVKTRRKTLDEGRSGSRTKQDAKHAASGKTRSASYDSNVTTKKSVYISDDMDLDESDDYSYIDEEETVERVSTRDYSSNPVISTRIIAVLVIVLVLLIMLFLVIRNSQLTKKLAESETLITQAEVIKGLNEKLTANVDELKEKIADLESKVPSTSSSNTQTSTSTTQNSSTDTISNESSADSGQNTERTYSVKKGDNLSKISKEFYGNAGYYQKIIDYNNLTSDVLSVGTVLKIPPLE